MTEKKLDRRVQRTQALLRNALMQLIADKGYDAVTIEDITERANLGRTTFYLHYQSKDDLLLDHHVDFTSKLNLDKLTREQLLGEKPQSEMIAFLQQINQAKDVYLAFTRAKDADVVMRNIQQHMMSNLQDSLQAAFPDNNPNLPIDVLTNYLVRGQFALIDWWVTTRTEYDTEQLAIMLHRLQRAAIRDAYDVLV